MKVPSVVLEVKDLDYLLDPFRLIGMRWIWKKWYKKWLDILRYKVIVVLIFKIIHYDNLFI